MGKTYGQIIQEDEESPFLWNPPESSYHSTGPALTHAQNIHVSGGGRTGGQLFGGEVTHSPCPGQIHSPYSQSLRKVNTNQNPHQAPALVAQMG